MSQDTDEFVEIDVLGPVRVRVNGVEQPIGSAKQRALLVRLVVDAGLSVTTDELRDALWGDTDRARSSANLKVLVSRLRKSLRGDVLETVSNGYRLDPERCAIDAVRFQNLVSTGVASAHEDRDDEALTSLNQAMALWRGGMSPELDYRWASSALARWTSMEATARRMSLMLRARLDPSERLVADLDFALMHSPHDESLHVAMVDVLRRIGQGQQARRALVDAVVVLDRDLGLVPGPALQRLAAEFQVPAIPQNVAKEFSIPEDLKVLGSSFRLDDAFSNAKVQGIDDIDLIDRLEGFVATGHLSRRTDVDGTVVLTWND